MTESAAIQSCLKHRDSLGFEYLVKKYRREAYMHAMIFMGNAEDAADACQESFTRAFEAFSRLQTLDAFYPWFYRILKNCCLNMLSRKKTSDRYRRHNAFHLKEEETPSSLFEKQDEKVRIWDVLYKLPLNHREILIMKYIKECRYDEISVLLEIPRGTVMSRLYHARKAFREAYQSMTAETQPSKEMIK